MPIPLKIAIPMNSFFAGSAILIAQEIARRVQAENTCHCCFPADNISPASCYSFDRRSVDQSDINSHCGSQPITCGSDN